MGEPTSSKPTDDSVNASPHFRASVTLPTFHIPTLFPNVKKNFALLAAFDIADVTIVPISRNVRVSRWSVANR